MLGLGVIAGAYAAHGLDETLSRVHGDKPPVARLVGPIPAPAKALDDFRTGVRYHVWHALGMIVVGLAGLLPGSRNLPLQSAGVCFGLGILGFSFGLYGLSVTGQAGFGIAAPVGGSLMILGWFLLAAGTCPCGSRSES